jgi:uncharacterized protein YndB with AHSA1/START domain
MTTPLEAKPNEIKLMRFFEAPVKTVWEAWTDPKQAAQWWGPRGFTLTSHSKELKPGGMWHYTMHGPNGADYVNKTKFLEVETYKKMVYDHGGNDERKPMFRVTVLFSEVKGGTKMDMTMAFPSPEDAAQGKSFIKKAGGDSTWDRFAEYLEKQNSGKEIFVINRSFDAPLDVMWGMWTKPEHFSKWLAPTGFNMKFLQADIKSGGKTAYSMSAENGGMTMHGRAAYSKVEKPVLVYTQQFTDEKGNVSRHPAAPTWPETMRTTVRFTEEGPQRTRVTVTWEVVGETTKEEMDTFVKGRAGMTQGWTGSFDKLEEFLLTSTAK